MPSFDVHQHLWPEPFVAALRARNNPPHLTEGELVLREGRFPVEAANDELTARIELLDRDEIDVAVISLQPTLGTGDLPPDERDLLEEAWIDGARELVAASGGRFRAFASGRLVSGFAGTSVAARDLYDLDLIAPLLDELERSAAPLFVHPGAVRQTPDAPGWWTAVVDYTSQMQMAYFRWLAEGRARWPDLRVAFAILAGGAPFQLERLGQRGLAVRSALDPNVYLDVATYARRSIELCAETFGVERLLYGSDRPVVDPAATLRAVRGFGESVEKLLTVDNPTSFLR
jgi:predicted TIM-barrel fold metal-dependent hydrolase